MRKLFGFLAVALFLVASVAGVADASTTVNFKATFTEQYGGPNHSPFVCASGDFCGSGEVTGLGQAQDAIDLGACGFGCSIRTLTFGDGSTIVMRELMGGITNPGNEGNTPGHLVSYGNPTFFTTTDTIIGGSGRFAGASGTASTEDHNVGGAVIIKMTGTITF
jgi:hypothetical protein